MCFSGNVKVGGAAWSKFDAKVPPYSYLIARRSQTESSYKVHFVLCVARKARRAKRVSAQSSLVAPPTLRQLKDKFPLVQWDANDVQDCQDLRDVMQEESHSGDYGKDVYREYGTWTNEFQGGDCVNMDSIFPGLDGRGLLQEMPKLDKEDDPALAVMTSLKLLDFLLDTHVHAHHGV